MIIPIKAGAAINHNKVWRAAAKIRSFFAVPKMTDYREVPVIINNFNRLSYLIKLIDWLESAHLKRIFIIDNNSTYPPLLDYYKKSKHIVFKLDKNVGHLALWETHIYMWFQNRPYIYTDPDLIPVDDCPNDVITYFWQLLERHPDIGKVGFGLKVDDLPDHFLQKQKVIDWENQFWKEELSPGVYKAKIDTTFALYRPNAIGGWLLPAIRTGFPHMVRHLPWYIDSGNLDDEEKYYVDQIHGSSSWYKRSDIYEGA